MADLPLPYEKTLSDVYLPLKIQLTGAVKEAAVRFEVDLKSSGGEFLFHFNPRFNEDCVVRSSTKDGGQWQTEERDGGLPFTLGKPFNIEITIEEAVIVCSVDGNRFCEFQARDDLHQLSIVYVDGDIQLESINLHMNNAPPNEPSGQDGSGGTIVSPVPEPHPQQPEDPHVHPQPPPGYSDDPHPPTQPTLNEPQPAVVTGPQGKLPTPYHGPLEALVATNRMRIVGTPHANAHRFIVNWKSNNGETLFHFNPRFDQNCVVRNSTVNFQYPPGGEEREGNGCPFHPGKQFALDFLVHDGNLVRCFVDGIEFCRFQARADLRQVATLEISGDLALDQVLIA